MENTLLKVNDLSFSYGNKQVLRNVSCLIEQGCVYTLLGKNGSGKTTFFKCVLKQNKIQENNIYFQGSDITKISISDYSKLVSYVPQLTSQENYDISVRDYLVQGRTPFLKTFGVPGKDDYLISLRYARMTGIENMMGSYLNELSGGELQMINITRALIQETPLIVMDEPLSALDIPNQLKVLSLIEQLEKAGKTIIFSSHNPNHAIHLNSKILLLKNGEMLTGDCSELIDEKILSETYGCDIHVYHQNGGTIVMF